MDRNVLEVSSLSLSFSDYLPTYQPIFYVSIYLSIYLSIYPSIHPSIHLSISLSIYLSIDRSIYLSIYLSLSLSPLPAKLQLHRPRLDDSLDKFYSFMERPRVVSSPSRTKVNGHTTAIKMSTEAVISHVVLS